MSVQNFIHRTHQADLLIYTIAYAGVSGGVGYFAASKMDQYFPHLRKSERISFYASIILPILGGLHFLVVASGVNKWAVAAFAIFEAGFVVGIRKAWKDLDQKVVEKAEVTLKHRSSSHLRTLNLSCQDLTDEDLKKWSEKEEFKNAEHLLLCENPRITAGGLAEYVGKKAPQLKWLDLSFNSQFTGEHLNAWVQIEEFKNLETLELESTNLKTEELETIIEQPWGQNLKGINVMYNPSLRLPPNNLSKMKKLGECPASEGSTGARMLYKGQGMLISIWYRHQCLVDFTDEMKELMKQHKMGNPF